MNEVGCTHLGAATGVRSIRVAQAPSICKAQLNQPLHLGVVTLNELVQDAEEVRLILLAYTTVRDVQPSTNRLTHSTSAGSRDAMRP